MKKLLLLTILVIMSGCTSVYHIGANVHDNGTALHRPVPKKVAGDMKAFEEIAVAAILKGDQEKINEISDPLLLDKIKTEPLQKQLELIKTKFSLNGGYERVKLHNSYYYLDEIMSQDPYKIYDFIGCEYKLVGNPNVRVLLLIDKKTEFFKLWGFSIHPSDPDNKKSELTYFAREIKGWWTFGDRR